MTYDRVMNISASWAALLTAGVAVLAYSLYQRERWKKLSRLEAYLKAEKTKGDKGQRTVLHLVAKLRMTESDVFDAAFRSKHLRCVTTSDAKGRVDALLFEYRD